MANVGTSAVRIIDSDNDVVTVTSNRLDVNATLVAGATIDIGDVDLFLDGGTALLGGSGANAAGVLRVTLATDDTLGGVIYADDADWTDGSSKHLLVGGLYQSSPQTVTDGDVAPLMINANGRLAVKTEQDEAFGTWVTYADFEAATSPTAISDGSNGTGASITDAKEILIQTDDANTGYIMIGSASGTGQTLAGTVGSRAGVKLNGGETLVLALSTFANIFIDASASSQFVNVAYFK